MEMEMLSWMLCVCVSKEVRKCLCILLEEVCAGVCLTGALDELDVVVAGLEGGEGRGEGG